MTKDLQEVASFVGSLTAILLLGAQESFLEDGRIYCPNHSNSHSSKNKDKATAPTANDGNPDVWISIWTWTSLASVVKRSLSLPFFEQDSISTTPTAAKSTNGILLFNWWTFGGQWRQIAFIVTLQNRSSTDSRTCSCCCFQIVNISFYCHRKRWKSKCKAKMNMLFVTRVPRW